MKTLDCEQKEIENRQKLSEKIGNLNKSRSVNKIFIFVYPKKNVQEMKFLLLGVAKTVVLTFHVEVHVYRICQVPSILFSCTCTNIKPTVSFLRLVYM